MQHRCKFCGSRVRRKRFENTNAYLSRDYCSRPKCSARGREEQLAAMYAKEKDDPAARHSVAFVTRALFMYRWGMEAMDAMDRYGKEASDDWHRVYDDVRAGKAMQVRVNVQVLDPEDTLVAEASDLHRFHLDDELTESAGSALATELVHSAHERVLAILYGDE